MGIWYNDPDSGPPSVVLELGADFCVRPVCQTKKIWFDRVSCLREVTG